MSIKKVEEALWDLAIPERATHNKRFFKSGKGEYAEGDQFIGVRVPDMRAVAKSLWKDQTWEDLRIGIASPYHELRLTTLFLLIHRYKAARKDLAEKESCIQFYLDNLAGVNNWDLVDSSCHILLGDWFMKRDRDLLYEFAESGELWKQRIAMVTTYAFIKKDQFQDTLQLAEILLFHEHDLIHKAVGWMLREMGNRDEKPLLGFLERHAHHMPRTALRYSIEKFDKDERQYWMTAKDRKQ